MSEGARLTKETHATLKSKGYRFLSIHSVVVDAHSGKLSAMSLQAIREMPHMLHHSCTGIDDAMILDLIGIEGIQLTLTD